MKYASFLLFLTLSLLILVFESQAQLAPDERFPEGRPTIDQSIDYVDDGLDDETREQRRIDQQREEFELESYDIQEEDYDVERKNEEVFDQEPNP